MSNGQPPQQAQAVPQKPKSYTEYVTIKQPIDESSRKWQLTSSDLIEELRQRLKGNTWDAFKKEWIKIREPLMNEEGIGEMCSIVASYLNKNQFLSYYEPEEIRIKLIDFEESLTFKFESDWEIMGIRKEDIDMTFLIIADTVWASTNRARYGGEKQFIEGTEQRRVVEAVNQQGGQQRSAWSSLPFIGGK